MTTTYTYDDDTGELKTINYGGAAPTVTMWYNRLGRLKQVSDAVGTRFLTYDAALQLATEKMIGLINKTITRSYESAQAGAKGRPTILEVGTDADPDADYKSECFYDASGRLDRVTGPGLPAYGAVYSRELNSELLAGHTFNTDPGTVVGEVIRSYELNRDLITSIENKWAGSQVSKYSYINDERSRRKSILRAGPAFQTGTHFDIYGYNDRNELTGSTRYNASDPTDPQPANREAASDHGYVYDNIGNRESYTPGTASPTTYTTNNLNQYATTATPAETFTHDFDGNLTGDADYTYTWNGENRLTWVLPNTPLSVGDKKLQFTYDYLGRRVRKLVIEWNGTQWNQIALRLFIYDGWNLLLELDAMDSSNVDSRYTWGMDLSGTLHGAGGIGGLLATHDVDSSTDYVYFHDANGNVGQLVNISDGSVDAKYEYDPYGGDTSMTGSFAATNPFRFSTKYLDLEVAYANGANGLYYYGFRYYSPHSGRWLNRDPRDADVREAGLYVFVRNGPASNIDLLGKQTTKPVKHAKCGPLGEELVPLGDLVKSGQLKDDPWVKKKEKFLVGCKTGRYWPRNREQGQQPVNGATCQYGFGYRIKGTCTCGSAIQHVLKITKHIDANGKVDEKKTETEEFVESFEMKNGVSVGIDMHKYEGTVIPPYQKKCVWTQVTMCCGTYDGKQVVHNKKGFWKDPLGKPSKIQCCGPTHRIFINFCYEVDGHYDFTGPWISKKR